MGLRHSPLLGDGDAEETIPFSVLPGTGFKKSGKNFGFGGGRQGAQLFLNKRGGHV